MAGMCCGVVGETNTPSTSEHSSGGQGKRRRRMEIEQLKLIATAASNIVMPVKRRKVETIESSCDDSSLPPVCVTTSESFSDENLEKESSRFGLTVVCGRRRDLEDAVSVKPSFCCSNSDDLHFYGVYDGHGCSHVINLFLIL